RLGHLEVEVVALTGALADACKHGDAAVLLGDVVDQLLDQHRLAEPGAAEEADLAAAHEGRDQVDHLDPGLEDLRLRRQVAEWRRVAVNWPALAVGRLLLVDGLAEHVPETPKRRLAYGNGDRAARVAHVDPPRAAVRRGPRARTHPV